MNYMIKKHMKSEHEGCSPSYKSQEEGGKWSIKKAAKRHNKEAYRKVPKKSVDLKLIPQHLCFKQAHPNMCHSSKVDNKVEIFFLSFLGPIFLVTF